jgi:hypothetical protein
MARVAPIERMRVLVKRAGRATVRRSRFVHRRALHRSWVHAFHEQLYRFCGSFAAVSRSLVAWPEEETI